MELACVGTIFRYLALPSCTPNLSSKKKCAIKSENQGFWPPSNLPKSSENPSKNDIPKSMQFFVDFCLKIALSHKRQHQFRIGFTVFFACRTLFLVSLFACILDLKNLPKTLPKRSPNDEKIDVKNVLFFNIDFLGFRPRFWSLLGLQLGAKLAILAQNSGGGMPP